MPQLQRLLVLLCVVGPSLTHKLYQAKIPNGENVPHPCKSNYVWKGVGHKNVLGGGTRNPFGEDLAAAGHTWSRDLCMLDSDRDGKTNGEELGDPNCVWSEGGTPNMTSQLSHPGVCEPTDTADCLAKNSWNIDCSEGTDFTCQGIADADTLNVSVRLDRTLVPTAETTYICQTFTLPSDKEYHLFASKPEIDNEYVMHHTILYGCADDSIGGFETPTSCNMGSVKCQTMLAAWTLGLNGECSGSEQGFLVGKGHFTKVLLEQHWNNPTNEATHYDSSGLTLFLTPNLRRYNMGFLITGQEALTIPAGLSSYSLSGICSSSCTNERLKDTIYVDSANLHMHYLGAGGKIEHWRDGRLYDTWLDESSYSYEYPIVNAFDPPKEFRKGDEIKTTCVFDSSGKTDVTNYGQATSAEMCYGFMTYYPSENGPEECVSYEDYDACELELLDSSAPVKQSMALIGWSFLLFIYFI